MLIRVGNFSIEVTGAMTHKRYQEVIKLASMRGLLRDTEALIIENAVAQNLAELKRLEGKRKRLLIRIQEQERLVNGKK